MPADSTDRLLDSLTDSTKAQQQATRRIDALERRLEGFETTVGTRFEGVEREMGTMNAKLDNLIREAQLTNHILKTDSDERRDDRVRQRKIEDEERARRTQIEKEERTHQLKLEEDSRATWKKVGAEAWRVLSQPVGFLVAGVVAWLMYNYLAVPNGPAMPPAPLVIESPAPV